MNNFVFDQLIMDDVFGNGLLLSMQRVSCLRLEMRCRGVDCGYFTVLDVRICFRYELFSAFVCWFEALLSALQQRHRFTCVLKLS